MNSRAGPRPDEVRGYRRSGEWAGSLRCLAAGLLPETGYRPRLPDSVSPNAHEAVREHPGRNAVTAFRVWIPCGFHPGRPERRRRSRDEHWRLSARWTGWRGQKFPSHSAFTVAASLYYIIYYLFFKVSFIFLLYYILFIIIVTYILYCNLYYLLISIHPPQCPS